MWWRQVWLVRMLVMKHWKCNIFPKYCKTFHKTSAVLEAQKKDSLVSGTEERKKWINNLFSLGNVLHQSHWWTREWRKCGLENFLQVWLELWHSCGDAAESTGHRIWLHHFTKIKWRTSGLWRASGAILSLKLLHYNNSLILFEQGFRHCSSEHTKYFFLCVK